MSFNSILAMAGVDTPSGGEGSSEQRTAVPRPRPALPTTNSSSSGTKRKADISLEPGDVKVQRQEAQIQSKYTGTAAPRKGISHIPGKPMSTPVPKTLESKTSSSRLEPSSIPKKPVQSTETLSASKTATRPSAPVPPAVAPMKAVKGSFQDIMNRAKALQETKLAQDRKIVNKATEIRKKEDRKKLLAQGKSKSKSAPTSRSGSTEPSTLNKKLAGSTSVRDKPKPELPAYKGTARPIAPAAPVYKGTANLHSSKQGPKLSSGYSKDRYNSDRYGNNRGRSAGYDEEEEDYDSEEGYESSDMEAGILDIDEEEELALKQARKEDAAALREENELKRQKLMRKHAMVGRR